MSTNEIAFFIGLFGSIHCIGMCGPLAFAIPVAGNSKWLLIWDKLIYQVGRIISYTILGLLIGTIGKQLWLSGLQQGVSILSGVLIIVAAFSRLLKISHKINKTNGWRVSAVFSRLLTLAVQRHWGHLAIGVLNGFLPCGFVYFALIGALNTNSVLASGAYMFWFGIGTLPLMLIAAVSTGLFNVSFRRKLNRVVPYFMLCLGIWFVLRGMSLDIPYLSPAKTVANGVSCVGK